MSIKDDDRQRLEWERNSDEELEKQMREDEKIGELKIKKINISTEELKNALSTIRTNIVERGDLSGEYRETLINEYYEFEKLTFAYLNVLKDSIRNKHYIHLNSTIKLKKMKEGMVFDKGITEI